MTIGHQNSSGEGGGFFYRVFGLTIASELALPEAAALDPRQLSGEADVHIRLGSVPTALPGGTKLASWLEFHDTTCLLSFEKIGRFLVESGRQITVEKDESASFDDLRGFLFGSGFGALAHQRGLIPLHVSALAAPGGAIAFTGESGAGKSTLAALLNQELKWPLICDDTAVLRPVQDRFLLNSGMNTVKLWRDALQALNRESEGLRRDLTRYDKFHAIIADRFVNDELALRTLVRLEWGDEVRLQRVTGRRAYQIAIGAIYRPELAMPFANRTNLAAVGMALASAIDIFVLERPKDHATQPAIIKCIEQALCADK